MTTVLKWVGILLLGARLIGKGAALAGDKITYEILPIRKEDFRVQISDEYGLIGVIKLRLKLQNSNPVPIRVQSFQANIDQAGTRLSQVSTTNIVELPPEQVVQTSITLNVLAGNVLDRIRTVLNRGGLLAPLEIQGKLHLTNNTSVPVNTKVAFFTVG